MTGTFQSGLRALLDLDTTNSFSDLSAVRGLGFL